MATLKVKYSQLFSVSVIQPFYQNKVCKTYQTTPIPDFAFVPTPACVTLMNRLGFLFKADDMNDGFSIYALVSGQNGSNDDLLRFHPKPNDKLSFLMVLKNPDVVNFNDLPIGLPTNYLYYFDNTINAPAVPRSQLYLSKDAAGVKGANDAIEYAFSNYSFHYAAPVDASDVLLKHLQTGITIPPQTVINQNGEADISFDLTNLPSGLCQLLIANLVEDSFYYVGNNIAQQPIFGAIEIMLSATLAANYRVMENDFSLTTDRPVFTIPFINRTTNWRYTFQYTDNSPIALEMAALSPAEKTAFINQLNIVCNDNSITFAPQAAPDGQFVFASANVPPLQEKYFFQSGMGKEPLGLSLKKYIGDPKEAVLKSMLAYPSTNVVNATVPPIIYSDIFLTI